MITLTNLKEIEAALKEFEDAAERSSEINAIMAASSRSEFEDTCVSVGTKIDPENFKTLHTLKTISAKIIFLDSLGLSRVQIAKVLSVHRGRPVIYQHVRNVLNSHKGDH